ncbi:MAG: hypothetical protein BMS9Abin05_0003 [Rhodothermia bacterium]|nr:MAG: hypothetical protein BMS9Abin05_0003 [Rhodothermia bacterium]
MFRGLSRETVTATAFRGTTHPPESTEDQMKAILNTVAVLVFLFISATTGFGQSSDVRHRGVSEMNEGTVRKVYVDKPLVGAKGYVVGDWDKGQVRVEVKNFPSSDTGYEVFLFEIDAHAYISKMFVDGDPEKGIVSEPPPFGDVAGLITQWYSLGDIEMNEDGTGTLEYREGDNLYETGLNMMFILEKVTPGRHDGPEDTSKLMVECNGPLTGTKGSEGMEKAIKVFSM